MASIITATTTSGLTQSADNSGVLQLASGTGNLVTVPSVTGTAMVSGNMPAFSVSRTGSNQTISVNTFTKVQLNTEEFDTNNCFDSTTNYRFTPNVAGYYQINGAINAESSTGSVSRCIASLYKNGAEFKRGSDTNAIATYMSVVSTLIYFNGTTDYVELYAYISASTAVIGGSATLTYFNGSMVRAA